MQQRNFPVILIQFVFLNRISFSVSQTEGVIILAIEIKAPETWEIYSNFHNTSSSREFSCLEQSGALSLYF